ncbi:hypothetical protein H8356DRAFT_1364616 [Neocallimastix lanati (nom. inval.)]|nr:hypothetical protein H8356DRAFT_1364616 [Neocallimastix sp. JGI-2020a]
MKETIESNLLKDLLDNDDGARSYIRNKENGCLEDLEHNDIMDKSMTKDILKKIIYKNNVNGDELDIDIAKNIISDPSIPVDTNLKINVVKEGKLNNFKSNDNLIPTFNTNNDLEEINPNDKFQGVMNNLMVKLIDNSFVNIIVTPGNFIPNTFDNIIPQSDAKASYVITNDLLKFESPITNDYTRTNELDLSNSSIDKGATTSIDMHNRINFQVNRLNNGKTKQDRNDVNKGAKNRANNTVSVKFKLAKSLSKEMDFSLSKANRKKPFPIGYFLKTGLLFSDLLNHNPLTDHSALFTGNCNKSSNRNIYIRMISEQTNFIYLIYRYHLNSGGRHLKVILETIYEITIKVLKILKSLEDDL